MEHFISSDEKREGAGEAEQWAKHLPLSTHNTLGTRAEEQSLEEAKDEGTVGEGSRPSLIYFTSTSECLLSSWHRAGLWDTG